MEELAVSSVFATAVKVCLPSFFQTKVFLKSRSGDVGGGAPADGSSESTEFIFWVNPFCLTCGGDQPTRSFEKRNRPTRGDLSLDTRILAMGGRRPAGCKGRPSIQGRGTLDYELVLIPR